MEAFIIANLAFAGFYLVYMAVFRRLTFFQLNRFYLLFALIFSALLPFIEMPSSVVASDAIWVAELPTILINASQQHEIQPVVQTAFWVYWIGVLVGSLFVFRGLYSIHSMRRKSASVKAEADKYLVGEGNHAFSFFNQIQIGAAIDREMHDMILIHEQVHKQQGHSVDVMIYAVARVVAWFNPFVHFAAKEVQLNHEYLADKHTMEAYGRDYQYSLLNQALDTRVFQLTNAFHTKSIIKNRILMMNKNRNQKRSVALYALILPLLAGALWLNACTQQPGVPDAQAEEGLQFGKDDRIDGFRSS